MTITKSRISPFLLITLLVMGLNSFAQILKPVKWSFSVSQQKPEEATLIFTAKIDKGFHVYSQFVSDGPNPTSFDFKKSSDFDRVGAVKEGKAIEEFDVNFDTKLKYFEDKAVFKQVIKVKSVKDFKVTGTLNYMCCNDKMCLPPEDVEFSFTVKGNPNTDNSSTTTEPKEPATTVAPATIDSSKKDTSSATQATPVQTQQTEPATINETPSSPWGIFAGGFAGGLLALLTPCVFPMIPLTVSFFTKRSGTRAKGIRNALLYGFFIIAIYVLLGFGVAKVLGADALNDLASNGIFNMVFFLILIVFAASFLGAFEITLPSSWVNAADTKAEKGGFVGIFFMAFTLSLVSFSCTGPIIGNLLVIAATGKSDVGPLLGMFGFSLALALPFALFAMFPSWLNTLPKSGGWLNSVKVVLGFLELALALKFFSNVDLAYHWRLLDREVFLVLWIIIFALLGLYLLGKLKFSHDSDLKYISIPRLFLAIVSLSFSLYMVPGLWGAPLKAISAFSPPQANQDFDLHKISHTSNATHTNSTPKKYGNLFEAPHGLDFFFDYDEAVAYAKKVNKPLFIDFTGHSCVNCRKMEASVWSDPRVLERFNNDYVLLSLYVDDKTSLTEKEQYISTFSGKTIKTIGNKWSDIQASKYNTNSQPYYVILGNDGQVLVPSRGFDLDADKYVQFLEDGKKAYQLKK